MAKRMETTTIGELQSMADARGGECLSKAYLGSRDRIRWRCGNGHEWAATAPSVKAGKWCLLCSILAKKHGQKPKTRSPN